MAKRIIACLDVHAGRVVKGVKFQDLKEQGDPAELAARYGDEGADEITFLDITATVEERATLQEVVRRTAERLFVPLTVGGGVRTVDDAQRLLRAGADKISINTAALADPTLIRDIARDYGAQCVVVAIDAKQGDLPGQWTVHTHGGRRATGRDVVGWAREAQGWGAGEIMLTSIDRDGTRDGYDLALTRAVAEAVHIPVVASGGCGSAQHALDALTEGKADAALVAGIFHEGLTTPRKLKQDLMGKGVEVRP